LRKKLSPSFIRKDIMTATNTDATKNKKSSSLPLSQLPRTLFSRRWWWTTLIVILGVIVMARLGIWQLDRLQQRKDRNATYLEQISVAPLELTAENIVAAPILLNDRLAVAQGSYDFSEQIVLVQQNWQGRPGAHLVTPLVLADGQTAVMVNRGWIPSTDISLDLSEFDEPDNLPVEGSIQLSQELSGGRETIVNGPQRDWYRIDIEAIQEQMPYDLFPFYLLATPPEGYQEQLPYRIAPDIDLSDGPHLGYAIQWFLFASILGIGYVLFVRTRS
jgi:surfeit locus 1 family protein